MLKNAVSALYLQNGWMDLTKPTLINYWEMEKKWSAYGDFDLIFKVIESQRMLKNALSQSCVLKGLIDYGHRLKVEKN